MNQIPNIEETYNTREVEEVVKEFYKIFDTDNLWQGEDEWTKNVPIGNIEQWLRTILHHQLQKARQDWLRKEIVRLEEEKSEVIDGGEFGAGMLTAIDDIIDRYQAELNQDNK